MIPYFRNNQNEITCAEAADLYLRINREVPVLPEQPYTADEWFLLSDSLRVDFTGQPRIMDPYSQVVVQPAFVGEAAYILEHPWFSYGKKCLALLHKLGEFLDRRYHKACYLENYRTKAPMSPILESFVRQLQRLDVSGWKANLPEFVRVRCCKLTHFQTTADEDSTFLRHYPECCCCNQINCYSKSILS
ncbi:hypothetical protein C5167_013819 [Papaver somniferum]|uniref:Uncharacterized protein n=1 Tax=Papaver somniferum TaxID=3469 RepID=A0A4Y7J4I4_PAPSO|nr:uncharacterized protein LOC113361504 [Papaver somniferum]RZC54960.1 hypothetical protein C5167_013819 [Papaver somniferum]